VETFQRPDRVKRRIRRLKIFEGGIPAYLPGAIPPVWVQRSLSKGGTSIDVPFFRFEGTSWCLAITTESDRRLFNVYPKMSGTCSEMVYRPS
jgi:hypothetical protein